MITTNRSVECVTRPARYATPRKANDIAIRALDDTMPLIGNPGETLQSDATVKELRAAFRSTTYALSVQPSVLRGYNGTLIVGTDCVLIRRGLRGVLTRKRRGPDVRIPFDEVSAIRFAPSGWLVGYLQVAERGAAVRSTGYLTTIRDPRTVTFLSRSRRWRRAAEELAARCGVPIEAVSAARYWGNVFGAVARRRR